MHFSRHSFFFIISLRGGDGEDGVSNIFGTLTNPIYKKIIKKKTIELIFFLQISMSTLDG